MRKGRFLIRLRIGFLPLPVLQMLQGLNLLRLRVLIVLPVRKLMEGLRITLPEALLQTDRQVMIIVTALRKCMKTIVTMGLRRHIFTLVPMGARTARVVPHLRKAAQVPQPQRIRIRHAQTARAAQHRM